MRVALGSDHRGDSVIKALYRNAGNDADKAARGIVCIDEIDKIARKGGGPSVASVVAGESHWTIAPAPATMSLVKSGRLRAIAHSMPRRAPLFGDMPAVAETVPGYDYSGWAGLLAPKATPKPVVDRLQAALVAAAANPALKDGFAAQGAEVVVTSPEEFRRFLEQDIASTARVVKAAGLQPE